VFISVVVEAENSLEAEGLARAACDEAGESLICNHSKRYKDWIPEAPKGYDIHLRYSAFYGSLIYNNEKEREFLFAIPIGSSVSDIEVNWAFGSYIEKDAYYYQILPWKRLTDCLVWDDKSGKWLNIRSWEP
jgi:hypothetical protein